MSDTVCRNDMIPFKILHCGNQILLVLKFVCMDLDVSHVCHVMCPLYFSQSNMCMTVIANTALSACTR